MVPRPTLCGARQRPRDKCPGSKPSDRSRPVTAKRRMLVFSLRAAGLPSPDVLTGDVVEVLWRAGFFQLRGPNRPLHPRDLSLARGRNEAPRPARDRLRSARCGQIVGGSQGQAGSRPRFLWAGHIVLAEGESVHCDPRVEEFDRYGPISDRTALADKLIK